MKLKLRDKTVLLIVATSFVVLLIAGAIINARVRGAFL